VTTTVLSENGKDPSKKVIGIVTLDDIIDEII
jgi:CBS domain containing-hemolysin-like protein